MISTSQLQYRLKGNARTLAIISLLSATTLTAIGFTYSLYYSNEKNTRTQNPFDIQYVSNLHASFALKLFSNLLGTNLLTPVIISFALYTLIYTTYYMLTTKSYYDIVKS